MPWAAVVSLVIGSLIGYRGGGGGIKNENRRGPAMLLIVREIRSLSEGLLPEPRPRSPLAPAPAVIPRPVAGHPASDLAVRRVGLEGPVGQLDQPVVSEQVGR